MTSFARETGVDRRRLLVGGAAVAGLLAVPTAACAAEAPSEAVEIQIAEGRLRGVRTGGVDAYKGVPYGASVSDAGRFKPARPVAPWTGVLDASRLGTPSLQDPTTVYGLNEPAPGEDCLVLNVWTPAGGGKGRPVMFYSHGGGYTTGSGGSTSQDGAMLAREHDVVVVATNHRLGVLGYLYLGELGGADYAGSGNQGLSDIVLALKWVRRNIEAFGGDPANVTIFGESGGGAKTSCLYAMPSVAPLFSKAIIQSGPVVRISTPDVAAQTTRMFLAELGIAPADWRKVLDVPAPQVLAAQKALNAKVRGDSGGWRGIQSLNPGSYGPIVDGGLLPHHPFDPAAPASAADKPLMIGWLDNEAAFFAWTGKDVEAFRLDEAGLKARLGGRFGDQTQALIDAYRADRPGATPSDIYLAGSSYYAMGAGSVLAAERKAAQGRAPAYVYNIAYRSNRKMDGTDIELGAMHASDIPLVFNTVASPDTLAGSRADRFAAARNVSAMWANFARTGRPSAPGQPAWPAYDLKTRSTMVLDVACTVVPDRFGGERRAWAKADPAG
ncbi:carboxylesterase/lipase family protein [Caulobacter sp. UNC279MFTsu5.1]|uniref:carboxylesterase/lipase family protein n=1 Tax=Caulobacter sp. UNC279MFTsu5.1 TaxID=1502775 RepID=UPI00036EEBB4|nr:carboxylesterase family protein [Caulobacter sp. UNC279MFTsu5.1]SFK02235.1 para-nitrobenzyl esterase [Caulobacter sp. UNC279MFTsu5.1]